MKPNCEKCGLYASCKTHQMKPDGSGEIPILIVGEAPGATEDLNGRPFIGKSGKFLRETLAYIGIPSEKIRIMNAVNCRPPNNKTPTDSQIKYCRPLVTGEIDRFKPKVIICLGMSAIKSVIGHAWHKDFGSIRQWRGLTIPDRKLNAWVLPTYHPAFILRENNIALSKIFYYDLERATKFINKPFPELPEIDLRIVTDAKRAEYEIREMLYHLVEIPVVAFDYETNMLKPYGKTAKVVTVSYAYFYDGKIRAVSFPMFDSMMEWWRMFLRSDVEKAAANMKFEYIWSVKYFGTVPNNLIHDSLLFSHYANNTRTGKGAGLKKLVYTRLGIPPYDHDVEKYLRADHPETENKIEDVPILKLLEYNALDSAYELILTMEALK